MRWSQVNCKYLWEYTQRLIALFLIFPACVIVLPFGMFIFLLSPGPILIKQTREGKKGNPFNMFKLRTMIIDAENYLQKYLQEKAKARQEWITYGRLTDDPRIVGRVAKFARRFSIDELPQLLNVVKGEMNLIGPRPLPPTIAKLIPDPYLKIRRDVLPGITGLWQVSGRSELTILEIGQLDKIYIDNWTVFNDIGILFRTIGAVIYSKGAY